MFIVGLTGGLATGKSTVLSMFKDNGIAVIDADQVARKVLEPGTDAWRELINNFGEEVLHEDGKVNRAELGKIVFSDKRKLKVLNEITHHRIQKAMIKMAIKYFFTGHKYLVMEVPLLFETEKMIKFMHKIITVVCEEDQQLQRLCLRNNFEPDEAEVRIQCQLSLNYKAAHSDFVIDNCFDLDETRRQTQDIIKSLDRSNFTLLFRGFLSIALIGAFLLMSFFAKAFCNIINI